MIVVYDSPKKIYDFVKSILEITLKELKLQDYKILYHTLDRDQEKEIGIYLYENGDDYKSIDKNIWSNIKVHVQVNAENGEKGFFDALNLLTEFTHNIEKSKPNNLELQDVSVVGPRAVCFGTNEHNIKMCKSDIALKFIS